MESSLLAGWDNFYVITGGAAGGLTGLTFVVIALAPDAHRVRPVGVKTFVIAVWNSVEKQNEADPKT